MIVKQDITLSVLNSQHSIMFANDAGWLYILASMFVNASIVLANATHLVETWH